MAWPMSGRFIHLSVMLLCLANTADTPSPIRRSSASEASDAAVQVGHVFQSGGTDGLILYALVLSSFLLFIVSLVLTVSVFRYMSKSQTTNAAAFATKDGLSADQTRMYIESMDRTAGAIRSLAVAVANDLQERQAAVATLARLESNDGMIIALLGKLDALS